MQANKLIPNFALLNQQKRLMAVVPETPTFASKKRVTADYHRHIAGRKLEEKVRFLQFIGLDGLLFSAVPHFVTNN